MSIVEYEVDQSVAVLTLNSGENRFNPQFLEAVLSAMDAIEQQTEARTLVIKSAHEKIFSNGIDLEWLVPVIQQKDMETAMNFFYTLNKLFKRTVTYPLITIAAINGHAFAGGAIWSCAFDFRFMRSDRGFFCFPEVDLGIPFLPGMLMLLKKAIPLYKMEEMIYTGVRLTADQCAEHHIITKASHIDTLMQEVMTFAQGLNKKREIVHTMKIRMNKDIVYALDVEDVPFIESKKFHIG